MDKGIIMAVRELRPASASKTVALARVERERQGP